MLFIDYPNLEKITSIEIFSKLGDKYIMHLCNQIKKMPFEKAKEIILFWLRHRN
jgi:hypothetical protein